MSVTKEEINKTIARYEFGDDVWLEDGLVEWEYGEGRYNHAKKLYTESLDALVPVWEKLDIEYGRFYPQSCPLIRFGLSKHINQDTTAYYIGDAKTIQHAAALCTYKAIAELTKGKE